MVSWLSSKASELYQAWMQMPTNACQAVICVIGGLFCLLPLAIFPTSVLENGSLRAALPSQGHRDSAIVVLALIIPLLMDIMTEILNSFFKKTTEVQLKMQAKRGILNNMEQLVFLCGTAVVPLTAFIPRETTNWAYIYLCCQQCQFVMTGGAIAISLCRYDSKYWPVRVIYFIVGLLAISSVLASFTNNSKPRQSESMAIRCIQQGSMYAMWLISAVFCTCSIRWLYVMFPRVFRKSKVLASILPAGFPDVLANPEELNESLSFPFVYVITSVFAGAGLVVLSTIYQGPENYDARALYYRNVAITGYLLLITYGSLRMIKQEVVKGLVSSHILLETNHYRYFYCFVFFGLTSLVVVKLLFFYLIYLVIIILKYSHNHYP